MSVSSFLLTNDNESNLSPSAGFNNQFLGRIILNNPLGFFFGLFFFLFFKWKNKDQGMYLDLKKSLFSYKLKSYVMVDGPAPHKTRGGGS